MALQSGIKGSSGVQGPHLISVDPSLSCSYSWGLYVCFSPTTAHQTGPPAPQMALELPVSQHALGMWLIIQNCCLDKCLRAEGNQFDQWHWFKEKTYMKPPISPNRHQVDLGVETTEWPYMGSETYILISLSRCFCHTYQLCHTQLLKYNNYNFCCPMSNSHRVFCLLV